jgi:hypothetical protein
VSYKPVEFPSFGGLDLRRDPQETQGAVDLQNVMFDEDGVVRTRPGATSAATAAANATSVFRLSSSWFFLTTGSNLYAFNGPPFSSAGSTASTDLPVQLVPSPSDTTAAYFTAGLTTSTVKKVTTSPVISSPGGIPTGNCLGVQNPEERLVVGNAGNVTGKVAFSDAGTPETFGANNFAQLPGKIHALVSWNNQLFAFTAAGLFVFYGNSTDAAGQPEFNYRLVARVDGLLNITASGTTAVAGPDGVYFLTTYGIYKTTGGPPVSISDKLTPLLTGAFIPPYLSGQLASTGGPPSGPIHADSERLYVHVTNGYFLIYTFANQHWTWWRVGAHALMLPSMMNSDNQLYPMYASTSTTSILRLDPTATSDNGTSITSYYRSGFSDFGGPGRESYIREFLLDGVGTVDFKTAVDDSATLSSADSITLGTSPAIARGRSRTAVRGTNVSFYLGATSGVWQVARVIANIRGRRDAGPES